MKKKDSIYSIIRKHIEMILFLSLVFDIGLVFIMVGFSLNIYIVIGVSIFSYPLWVLLLSYLIVKTFSGRKEKKKVKK